MRFLSVCSGIEAASVAWEPLGWQASGFAEIEPFPCAVLAHHYPNVPNHGDMTLLPAKIRAGEVEAPDLLCGGTPCQAFSVAGLRQSLDDARGNLTLTFCEIADAIDAMRKQPSIVFWENVPGVLNTKDNAFGCFLGALAGEDDALVAPGGRWANAGFVDGPQRAVAWRVLDAQYFGVAQRRRRVFVVASARADFDPAAVLFEFEGVRRDTAPSREAGQAVARIVAPSLTASNDPSRSPQSSEVTQQVAAVVAARMVAFGEYVDDGTASAMKARDYKDATDLVAQPIAFEPGKLKRLGYGDAEPGLSPTLRADAGDNQLAVAQPIPFDTTQITSPQNGSNPKAGDPCHPLAAGAHIPAVAQPVGFTRCDHGGDAVVDGTPTMRCGSNYSAHLAVAQPITAAFKGGQGSGAGGIGYSEHVAPTLPASDGGNRTPTLLNGMAVRRLTPVECERLQGFPDNYTNIPWRKADQSPDGPRYKALGNSWAVPVVRWIGERIERSLG
jgi:DNA (cytosine-5)-methyltransferase 1